MSLGTSQIDNPYVGLIIDEVVATKLEADIFRITISRLAQA